MKKGYYTDNQGRCLGGWELNDKPQDTAEYKWFESDTVPLIYVEPPTTEEVIRLKKVQRKELEDGYVYSLMNGDMYDATTSWADKKKSDWLKLKSEIKALEKPSAS